jgi:release factor glutamine methyltransferase
MPFQIDAREQALVALGRALRASGYRFTTVTPETHRRVNRRPGSEVARDLVDVFGWSRPFRPGTLPPPIEDLLVAADAATPCDAGDLLVSRVRFSTLGADLFVHSAFPTEASAAVFFGPDTYRFAALLERSLPPRVGRLVDVGCGSGAGGLVLRHRASSVVLADINPEALRHAAVNAVLAGCEDTASLVVSDILAAIDGPIDTVVANPPYLVDDGGRLYRHGGDRGIALAARIVAEARDRLVPGGHLVLYSGTPVIDGVPLLPRQIAPLLDGTEHRWEEIDPDVFGEELDRPAYADVDRIAVLGLVLVQPGRT